MKPEIRKPTDEERQEALEWPIWTKEASTFPYEYDEPETCLIIQGQAIITNEAGEKFAFGPGDWVVFPEGLKCTWDITDDVQKHYRFG